MMNENSRSFLFNLTDDEFSSASSVLTRTPGSANENGPHFIETKIEKVFFSLKKKRKFNRFSFFFQIEPEMSNFQLKFVSRSSGRNHSQRQLDEEMLRHYNIPLDVAEITYSTTEAYNNRLMQLSYLSAEQIHVIKDIRRRGKNKVCEFESIRFSR